MKENLNFGCALSRFSKHGSIADRSLALKVS
jgi:hypothetical protein